MTGEELKERGSEAVLTTNLTWKHQIYNLLRDMEGTFTSEDVRERARELGIAEPSHRNGWGAIINAAARLGIIEKTGDRVRSRFPKSHAASLDVWRVCEVALPDFQAKSNDAPHLATAI